MKRDRLMRLCGLIALSAALGGCETQAMLDKVQDAVADFNPFGTNKKPLPGERRAVFPDGVPGVPQGVPPELMKGAPREDIAAPLPEEPKPEPEKKKAQPKPKPVKQAARPKPRSQPQQPEPGGWPAAQQPEPAQNAWPASPRQQQPPPSQGAWPAPPQQQQQSSQSAWPAPPQQLPSAWPSPPPAQRVQ